MDLMLVANEKDKDLKLKNLLLEPLEIDDLITEEEEKYENLSTEELTQNLADEMMKEVDKTLSPI